MKQRFRLFRRNGIYYTHDSQTSKQLSLGTRDRGEARELFSAKTQAHRQSHLNLRLARTYLTATDPLAATRTWQAAMDELPDCDAGGNKSLIETQKTSAKKAICVSVTAQRHVSI